MTIQPLTFELHCRAEAYDKIGPDFVRNEERDQQLPARPTWFHPLRGPHASVATKADDLNRAQRKSGFVDYFFFPDVATAAKA